MKIDVVNTQNEKVGEFELDDSVFGAAVRPHLFWEVVKMQLANRRAGTHSTKTVSEVRGSNTKPYKQKGTGRARHGNKRAMNMRGGGVVHGPRPRDYSYKMPRKMVQLALRSALSFRGQEQKLVVVRDWNPDAPKTKSALEVLRKFGSERALVVDAKDNDNLALSLRNLPKSKFIPVEALNVYDILRHERLVLSEAAATQLNERLKAAPSRKEQALKEVSA